MGLKLKSGFLFDYDNLYGEGKVTKADIEAMAEDLKKAHEAMQVMRSTGVIRAHLSKDGTPEKVLFSQLPYIADDHLNSPASLARLDELGEHVKNHTDAVVSLGIGGSFLGNKVLFDVECGDPRATGDLIRSLKNQAAIAKSHKKRALRVMLLVISKSGGTLDTMSNFMVVYKALQEDANIEVEVVAVTDPNEEKPTLLKKLAQEKGWQTFAVPDGVGGRFSIFSEVGLSLAACIGFDIKSFLAGARAMDEACQTDDVWQNPAMLNAALKFVASEKYGRDIEVMMPYGDYLKSVSEWYIQLLAESLGKEVNREGKEVCYGRTPVVAVGTTDMHAQTQQHQEGKRNKVVQFIRLEKWADDLVIPNEFPEVKKLADISGLTMGEALEVARQSNADALASNERFNALFSLPELNAYHLGELLYLLALSIAYEGELADVDAFNQPGVESYKRIMGPKLEELKATKK